MKNTTVQVIRKNKKKLQANWLQSQLAEPGLQQELLNEDELESQTGQLLDALLKGMEGKNFDDLDAPEFDSTREILSELSLTRARRGFTPRETGAFVLSLKKTLTAFLEAELAADPESRYHEINKINNLLDSLSIYTFESFIKGREDVIKRQSDEINEISTPVIRVWDGILAMPIIGTLDSGRTQIVMENLLKEIVNTGSSIAILDISGVPAVDSLVAQHLIKTVSATRLMGAECIISGIRPEIAQTIVHLGIDLSNIKTKSSLASALKVAYDLLGIEVKHGSKRNHLSI